MREPCTEVLTRAIRGSFAANTNVEVLQEVLNYYHRRGDLTYGQEVAHNALTLFPDPYTVTVKTFALAQGVLNDYPQLSTRDAIHAAVVLERGLEGIISTDRGFDAIPGVKRFDPRNL